MASRIRSSPYALQAMEDATEKPLSRDELARATGLSVASAERLFAGHLGTTIGDLYLKIRLDRARTLVHETALPLLEIAIACGFANGGHFSRAYSARYGTSPKRDRRSETASAWRDPQPSAPRGSTKICLGIDQVRIADLVAVGAEDERVTLSSTVSHSI